MSDEFDVWWAGFSKDGELDAPLIKATMQDYYQVQREVGEALSELTNGRLVSCNYKANDIVHAIQSRFSDSIIQVMNSVFGDGTEHHVDASGAPSHGEEEERPTLLPEQVMPSRRVISFPVELEAFRHPWFSRTQNKPEAGEVYEHYKGELYVVVGCACFSEATWLELVIYRSKRYGYTWARPLAMWNQEVRATGGPRPRFKRIE